MRLELALMSFHYLNRRRNSNPSPTSTTNPTKNPRSPPPSSSNSSFIPYHPRHQLEKHSVRPSISINPGRGIPTPPTLVSSPFGGMKGPPLSLCIESWRPEAMRTRTERTMWHCWPPMELISLSLFVPGDGIPPRGGRSERIRWRRAKVGNFAAANGIDRQFLSSCLLFSRELFDQAYAQHRPLAAPRAIVTKGDLCPKGGLFDLWFRKISFQRRNAGYNCKRHRISLLPSRNFSLVIVGEKQSTRIG